MDIEQLSVQKGSEKWVLTLRPIFFLDEQIGLPIDIFIVDLRAAGDLFLDGFYCGLIWKKVVNIFFKEVAYFRDDLSGELLVDFELELNIFLLEKVDKVGWIIFPHFFEL